MTVASEAGVSSASERLMDFAIGCPASDIPAEVMDWAVLRAVDTVGVALAGAASGFGTAGAEVILGAPAPGRSSVWASGGRRTRADDAAFANGMMVHGMDFDDTHTSATMHPGSVVVPTAFAVGEDVAAPGSEILAATVIGYEVAARLSMLTSGRFQARGFHPTSVLGIFGGIAAVSRLMGLSLSEASNAAGLAGSMSSGLMEYLSDGSAAKQMHPGLASRAAVTAVRLARHGATGPATILEGPKGVFRAFIGTEVDLDRLFAGLGEEWLGTRVSTKPYPACHCVHAPVDAWRKLRARLRLSDDDVARIRRFTGLVPGWYLQLVCDPLEAKQVPRSVYEARFSLPYSVAVAAVDGTFGIESYAPQRLSDQRVLDVASRVDYEVLEYEEFPAAFPGGIRVELGDGSVHEEHLRYNVGSLGNPMSAEEIQAKFRACAGLVADAPATERLLASLLQLGNAPSLGEFGNAMASFDAGLGREDG